ncbi:N-acetyltransferase GCN5 [Thalassotalea insulae]|uniref:N-acetyltransferase GCN5 n=1 Tax=Thalassotalea insulae TaxID=2056778 RepID=A0ABQ6GMQ1_9GAMM|nr:GNAT family N-acetyltransferase [Thalassotalea insulae]GLX77268.1 N-acetyltransferase GCN5 [Thalassotalea insulae]
MKLSLLTTQLSFTTERLQIRLMQQDDFPLFNRLQSDKALMQYIGPILSPEELKAKFNTRIRPWDGEQDHWLTLKIITKNTNEFIGSVGFRIADIEAERAEIGYLLLQQYQGHGYMTEATRALVAFLFNQLEVAKIEAHCCADNNASWKVMEKLGMEREGFFKSHSVLNQQRHDDLAYGLLAPRLVEHSQ